MSSRKYSPQRPIDKANTFAFASSLGTTQDNTTLRTSTVAETFTGGHLQLSISRVSGGGYVNCVLCMIPESVTIPTITITDDNPIIAPEEFALWTGSYYIGSNATEIVIDHARIKAMRKMKNGDRLVWSIRASAATPPDRDWETLLVR